MPVLRKTVTGTSLSEPAWSPSSSLLLLLLQVSCFPPPPPQRAVSPSTSPTAHAHTRHTHNTHSQHTVRLSPSKAVAVKEREDTGLLEERMERGTEGASCFGGLLGFLSLWDPPFPARETLPCICVPGAHRLTPQHSLYGRRLHIAGLLHVRLIPVLTNLCACACVGVHSRMCQCVQTCAECTGVCVCAGVRACVCVCT